MLTFQGHVGKCNRKNREILYPMKIRTLTVYQSKLMQRTAGRARQGVLEAILLDIIAYILPYHT